MTLSALTPLGSTGTPLCRAASPAARLLAGAVLVAAIATAPIGSLPALSISALVLLATLLAAQPRLRPFMHRALPAALVIAALVVPLVIAGRSAQALAMGARATLAVGVALGVAASLALDELPGALSALGVPAALAAVVETMLRQLGSVQDEGRRIVLARRLRGARGFGVGPEVLSALLVRTSARAERAELAMRLRGYNPALAREQARLGRRDLPLLGLTIVLAVLLHIAA